jgi:hypothetical protein
MVHDFRTGEETPREFAEFMGIALLAMAPAMFAEKRYGINWFVAQAVNAVVVAPLFILYLRYRGPQIQARKERWQRERRN